MSSSATISPRQVAQAIGVSESSLKRWCDQGLLTTVKTAGGHRRLSIDTVTDFLRRSGRQPVRPEILGLPKLVGRGEKSLGVRPLASARQDMVEGLLGNDRERCRRIVFELHLAGVTLSRLGDEVLAPALHCVGDGWAEGTIPIYRERRSVNLCLECVAAIRAVIAPPGENAPRAIGGTPECDPYSLPTTLVEGVLQQAGWTADSLGSRLPFSTLSAAIRDQKPKLFWLSVSHLDDEKRFVKEYRAFYESLPADLMLVVGGRALSESVRKRIQYTTFCDNLQHLDAFVRSWDAARSAVASRLAQ